MLLVESNLWLRNKILLLWFQQIMAMYSPLERTANEEQVCSVLANVLHIDIDEVEMELMKKIHLFWDMQMTHDIALVMFKIRIMKLNGDVEENYRVMKTKGTDLRSHFHQINVFIGFATYFQIGKKIKRARKASGVTLACKGSSQL